MSAVIVVRVEAAATTHDATRVVDATRVGAVSGRVGTTAGVGSSLPAGVLGAVAATARRDRESRGHPVYKPHSGPCVHSHAVRLSIVFTHTHERSWSPSCPQLHEHCWFSVLHVVPDSTR